MRLLSELENEGIITLGRGIVISKEEMQNNIGDYPVYSSSATGNGLFGTYGAYSFDDERITWSIDGGGKLFYREPHKYSVTNVCGWLKVNNKNKYLTKYVYYSLYHQWNYLEFNYVNKAHPSIIREIYKLEDISIEKQTKIVALLDKITLTIEREQKLLPKYDELIKSRFIEMFGVPDNNIHNYELSNIGNLLSLLTDFNANGSYEKLDSNVVMYDTPNYALMVRTTDLENDDIFKDAKYITQEAYELLSKSKLYGSEIIINKIGSAGKVYLMPNVNMPASLGRNAFMLRFKENVKIEYIYYYLQSEYGQIEISKHIKGAVTKTITKDSVRSIPCLNPPKEQQNEFAEFVKQIDKLKFISQNRIKYLEELLNKEMDEIFN